MIGLLTIIKRLISEPMSQRIDTESCLLHERDAKDSTVEESPEPVVPKASTNKGWEDQSHKKENFKVVAMLPDDDRVFVQIRDIGTANPFRILKHQHPSEMRIEKPFANRVWVFVGVGVTVMCSVISCPPSHGPFNSTATNSSKKYSQG